MCSSYAVSPSPDARRRPRSRANRKKHPQPPLPAAVSPEDAAPEPEETEIPCALPEKDLNGFAFTMLRSGSFFTERGVWTEELTGDAVPDAIYERNVFIEDKYNCTLEVLESTAQHPSSGDVPKYVKSGDDSVDMVLDGGQFIANTSENYRNMNALPYFDFSSPWWKTGSSTRASPSPESSISPSARI